MARMIDPSELDGEELFNWYRRSPDEVDAGQDYGSVMRRNLETLRGGLDCR